MNKDWQEKEKEIANKWNDIDNVWDNFWQFILEITRQLRYHLKKTNLEVDETELEGLEDGIGYFGKKFTWFMERQLESSFWLLPEFIEFFYKFSHSLSDLISWMERIYDFDSEKILEKEKSTLRQIEILRVFFIHPTNSKLSKQSIHNLFYNEKTNINIELFLNRWYIEEKEFLKLANATEKTRFIVNWDFSYDSDGENDWVKSLGKRIYNSQNPLKFRFLIYKNIKDNFSVCFNDKEVIIEFLNAVYSTIVKLTNGIKKWPKINRKGRT